MIHTLTIDEIQKIFTEFKFFSKGDYNLNIFGIRNRDLRAGRFNDMIYCVYKLDDEWQIKSWVATTDPGTYWLDNPMRPEGCAILKANEQYLGLFSKDLHRGKYEALCQRDGSQCKVYRDNDKNNWLTLDSSSIQRGDFSINLHTSVEEVLNKRSSAGCQVIPNKADFKELMDLVDKSLQLYSNSFTYTLFDSSDVLRLIA